MLFHFMFILMAKIASEGSFTRSQINGFRNLQISEDNLREAIYRFILSLPRFKKGFKNWDKVISLRLSGSIQQGSLSSRLFLTNQHFDGNVNREFDIDIEQTVMNLDQKYCVHDIKGKPGFVNLDISPNTSCFCSKCLTIDEQEKDKLYQYILNNGPDKQNKHLLPSYYIRDKYIRGYSIDKRSKNFQRSLDLIMWNTSFFRAFEIETQEKITKATRKMYHKLYRANKMDGVISFDLAFVAALNWTPRPLSQWLKRKRNWPLIEELGNEYKQGYIIAKSSHEEKNNTKSLEFQYTFSNIERKIISLQTSNQRLIFLIAKSIFYRWLKPIDENLSSFLIKNVMFWKCESYPPTHSYWGDGSDAATIKVVRTLYKDLHRRMRDGTIPYYFIPDINILPDISSNALEKVVQQIHGIISNTETFIPNNSEDVISIIANLDQIVRERLEFFNSLRDDDIDLLIKLYSQWQNGFQEGHRMIIRVE